MTGTSRWRAPRIFTGRCCKNSRDNIQDGRRVSPPQPSLPFLSSFSPPFFPSSYSLFFAAEENIERFERHSKRPRVDSVELSLRSFARSVLGLTGRPSLLVDFRSSLSLHGDRRRNLPLSLILRPQGTCPGRTYFSGTLLSTRVEGARGPLRFGLLCSRHRD